MTRQHFEAIAITLGARMRQYDPGPERLAVYATARDLATDFSRFNSAFDLDRFMLFVLEVAENRRDLTGKKAH